MRLSSVLLVAVLFCGNVSGADPKTVSVTISGGKEDLANVIAVVPIPAKFVKNLEVIDNKGKAYAAQLALARLLANDAASLELHILVPELKTGQKLELKATLGAGAKPKHAFAWDDANDTDQLLLDDRPILSYFHRPFDAKLYEPKKEIANPTTKPYHHLIAPDGKTIVTNSNEGQYPHHRGIFYGFNNISYNGKQADVWHCRQGEHTAHEKILAAEAGPLFGRHTLQIGWHGRDGAVFANERRELTVYNVAGGTMIDFASILTTPLEKVRLDGDPQHAGFHFRASSKMEKNTKETIFVRPDGIGKAGEEKNWDPKTRTGPLNLPWDAMSFVLDGERYTVVYLDHPDNPKEARQSERCYGRIGTYFEYDLTKNKPLKVKYRLWFQAGRPTVEQCKALGKAFVQAPEATVGAR
jgi:hypothetical protein